MILCNPSFEPICCCCVYVPLIHFAPQLDPLQMSRFLCLPVPPFQYLVFEFGLTIDGMHRDDIGSMGSLLKKPLTFPGRRAKCMQPLKISTCYLVGRFIQFRCNLQYLLLLLVVVVLLLLLLLLLLRSSMLGFRGAPRANFQTLRLLEKPIHSLHDSQISECCM